MKYILVALVLALFSGTMTSCNNAASKLAKADEAAKNKGEYTTAIKLYEEAMAKGADSGYVNGRIGDMYTMQNKLAQAEPFYEKAVKKGNEKDSVLASYSLALKANGKYDEAKAIYSRAAEKSANPDFKAYLEKQAAGMDKVKSLSTAKTEWEINNFEALNTPSAEFSPVIFAKDLYFTSSRNNTFVFKGDGTNFTDLYQYKIEGKKAGTITPLNPEVNQPGFMKATATFSKDGKMMIFAMSNDGSKKGRANVDLFISRKRGNAWSAPELMSISNPDAWDSSPAFSPDGKSLYFASDRPGGQGGSDIYRVPVEPNGKFTKLKNMGPVINTAGDEMFPYVSDDGKLYFSSTGHPGLGNLDIFVATQNQDKSINVDNMGPGINTSADDFGICLKTPLEGFISSNRSGGKGDDDIWVIRNSKNDLKIVKFVLLGETYEKTENGKLLELKGAKVRLIDDQMNTLGEVTTNDSAAFTFNLEANRNYTLLAEYPNHYAKRENFTTFGKQPPQEQLTEKETIITLEQDLILDPLKKGESFVLDNIYFDYDKADIKDSAALELDKVVTILTDNPTIEIEMSSHTDSRGAKDYNQKLSQRRAESTVQYLVSKGIAVKRLTAKGYGFEKPVILEAVTEEDHQRNRRTEFKVIKINKQ